MYRIKLICLFSIAFFILLVSPVFAGTILNPDGSKQNIIVWKYEDSFKACAAEKEATGVYGQICFSGVSAMVPPGTKARRIEGWLQYKIQILAGPSVGKIGYIPMEFFKP